MRRIYLTEDKINVIKERVISKLPSFLYKALSSHKTSLGNNAVFPSDDIYPFDYIIAKNVLMKFLIHFKNMVMILMILTYYQIKLLNVY